MRESDRQLVRDRAEGRCEYCRLPQFASIFTFHIEHIRARQHGGADDPANLALACPFCNRFKGPNLSGIDPDSDQITQLYDPRHDNWNEHFRLEDELVIGTTSIGRTTVSLLNMNCDAQIDIRRELIKAEEW